MAKRDELQVKKKALLDTIWNLKTKLNCIVFISEDQVLDDVRASVLDAADAVNEVTRLEVDLWQDTYMDAKEVGNEQRD